MMWAERNARKAQQTFKKFNFDQNEIKKEK
jgi:hypothetical protein